MPPAPALVFATIRRRAIDLARREDARSRREQAHFELDARWFNGDGDGPEMDVELERAVKLLPDIYQEVVVLKVWGGLTFQEVAEQIGVPMNTAASRYRYGVERLRELMNKET
jgi:RNA polymerase sigma-70 factor (ECF subfamily)